MNLAHRVEELLRGHSEFAKNTSGCIICKRSPHTTTYLPEKLSPELLRFIGVIHGDGNMSFSRILISDKDLRNVEKFCKIIMVKHPAKVDRLESYSLID